MKSRVLPVVVTVVLIMLGVMANVLLFMVISRLNEEALKGESVPAAAPAAAAAAITGEAALNEPASSLKSVKQQLETRIKIDDFLQPSLWAGAEPQNGVSGSITMAITDSPGGVYRKYDGFLDIEPYLLLDIQAVDTQNIEWATLYLMEDLSYANYFECNLLPLLEHGGGTVLVNRSDFVVGSGKPGWEEVSTVKIGAETLPGMTASITVHEISTYGAHPLCSIWFDDGWQTVYTDAYPLMKQNDIQGTLSVVSSYIDCPAFCSKAQLDEMYENGWDYVNHTHTHPNLRQLEPEEIRAEVSACYDYLLSRGYTRTARNIVPPYCAVPALMNELVADYALTSRPQWSMFNDLPITDPYNLGFMEVTSEIAPETVMGWIDKAIENDLWLVLLFHSIETPADEPTKYPAADFEKIVAYLSEKRSQIQTVTLSQGLEADNIIESMLLAGTQQTKPQEWELVWEENFDGGQLDESVWNIVNAAPFKNNELQTYDAEHVKTDGGNLNIISEKKGDTYFSGAVTTENRQLFQYGRIEIRAKLPDGRGIFPAFWLLPQSGESFPEIDIIEFMGHEPRVVWNVRYYLEDGIMQREFKEVKGSVPFNDDFHIYALEWTKDGLKWLVDGEETFSVSHNIPSGKMYLYINTAVGGDWPGNPDSTTSFPQTMLVDYVRYYRYK